MTDSSGLHPHLPALVKRRLPTGKKWVLERGGAGGWRMGMLRALCGAEAEEPAALSPRAAGWWTALPGDAGGRSARACHQADQRPDRGDRYVSPL